jgi:hypothetical protein
MKQPDKRITPLAHDCSRLLKEKVNACLQWIEGAI